MSTNYIEGAKAKRDDISRFLIHLTKQYDGKSSKENLISILESNTIHAKNYHCLFGKNLDEQTPEIKKKFFVACLTETPLTQIKNLFNIEGREVNLEPYGLVFDKSIIAFNYNGSPCIYANKPYDLLRNAFWRIYCQSKEINFSDNFNAIGALVNKIDYGYDFSWEREWRVLGDFEFDPHDVLAIISEDENIEIPTSYKHAPIINPYWGYEEMFVNIARKTNR